MFNCLNTSITHKYLTGTQNKKNVLLKIYTDIKCIMSTGFLKGNT